MLRWAGRVALVTGASSGIGAAVTERLVGSGMKVIGCARRLDKIEILAKNLETQPGQLDAIQCDLSSVQQILAMFDYIKKTYGHVDVCVNNGGSGLPAPLLGGDIAQWRQMLDVNVMALLICTSECVKSMEEKQVGDGHIIHIGSVLGHTGPAVPESSMYFTTKQAVRAITEAHRMELRKRKSNIRVSAISPGLVETSFPAQMRGEEFMKQIFTSIPCLQAKDIADAVEYVLSAPQHVQVHDIILRPTLQA